MLGLDYRETIVRPLTAECYKHLRQIMVSRDLISVGDEHNMALVELEIKDWQIRATFRKVWFK